MSRSCFSVGPVALAFCMFASAANAVPIPIPSFSPSNVPSITPSGPSIAGSLATSAPEGKTQGPASGPTQSGSAPWGPHDSSHGFWFDERELIRFILALERWEERREIEWHSHHHHNNGGSGGSAGGSTGQAPAPTPLPAPLLLLGSGLGLIGLIARRRKQAVVSV